MLYRGFPTRPFVEPKALSLPGHSGQTNAVSSCRIQLAPIDWLAQTVKLPETLQQHFAFNLIVAKRRQERDRAAHLFDILLYRAQQHRMRADFYKDVVFVRD